MIQPAGTAAFEAQGPVTTWQIAPSLFFMLNVWHRSRWEDAAAPTHDRLVARAHNMLATTLCLGDDDSPCRHQRLKRSLHWCIVCHFYCIRRATTNHHWKPSLRVAGALTFEEVPCEAGPDLPLPDFRSTRPSRPAVRPSKTSAAWPSSRPETSGAGSFPGLGRLDDACGCWSTALASSSSTAHLSCKSLVTADHV